MNMHPVETILQFGTGKFLRCFTDLFVHQQNEASAGAERVVALQSTGSQRAASINAQHGQYRVAIRGLEDGQPVDRIVEVCSISRALMAHTQWNAVLQVARSESLRLIVSNTTEAGYGLEAEERSDTMPPRTFPAKLLAALRARFEAGGAGVAILPCELYENNADRLRQLVLEQAARWRLSPALMDWLSMGCSWCNTLVDRIVSSPSPGDPLGATDPLFAVAEPFASWLIEGKPATTSLVSHPAVQWVDRLEPYALRKVRILNGAHTALVSKALPLGLLTVGQAIVDPRIGGWLRDLLFEEIVPVLAGRVEEPDKFAAETLERFANPFLEHRLADIALHHPLKLRTRLEPTYREYCQRFGRIPPRLREALSALLG